MKTIRVASKNLATRYIDKRWNLITF